MADALRQKIVTAVLARLRTIKTAAGYETNLGHQVFCWRNLEATPFTADEITEGAVVVRDKAEPSIDSTIQGRHDKDLQFELEIATSKAVSTAPTDATLSVANQVRKLIADVEKSLASHTAWITTVKVHKISALSVNDMDMVESGGIIGHARLQFSVEYSNIRFDPYNQ